jgi:hypothetical protein
MARRTRYGGRSVAITSEHAKVLSDATGEVTAAARPALGMFPLVTNEKGETSVDRPKA